MKSKNRKKSLFYWLFSTFFFFKNIQFLKKIFLIQSSVTLISEDKRKENHIMVIQGYLISESTDLLEIESQIQKVQKKILNIRHKEYQRLLGKEIAFCCDCIALNILQRPTHGSIADCAVDNLNRRIQVAQLSSLPSPYNLSIFLHVLQLDGKTYLRVDSNNTIFQKPSAH